MKKSMRWWVGAWVLTTLCQVQAGNESSLTDIYFAGLFPITGFGSLGVIAHKVTNYALNYVNNRSDVLPGYRLNMHWENTNCDPGLGVHNMYKLLYAPPVKLMVYGATCSKVTQPTAESSHFWNNLVQLSYVSTSPALSNKLRYPRFLRISSSDIMMTPARIEMCRVFGWTRVAIISESHELFTKVADDAHQQFTENNITLLTAERFTDDPSQQVRNLKKHDARIIFLGAYEPKGRQIMCEAYKIGLYGHSVVWLLPFWYTKDWWRRLVSTEVLDCTLEQLNQVIDGTFYTGPTIHSVYLQNSITDYGNTFAEFIPEVLKYINMEYSAIEPFIPQVFDGVYMMALALNMTMNDLLAEGRNKTLDTSLYDMEINELIYKNMLKVHFYGYKGIVYFNEDGEHPGEVEILRYQKQVRETVGLYKPINRRIIWSNSTPIIWHGGAPPADSTTIVSEPIMVQPLIYAVMVTLAILGIISGFGFITFNLKFRHLRIIKMSSPLVNNLIVVGCILCYSTVFWRELSPASTLVMCQARTFTLMVGFSTTFGALFAKTWRVHRIFTSKLNRVVMKDSYLVIMTFSIAAFDILLFLAFAVIDPQRVEIINTESVFEDNGDTLRQIKIYLCTSSMALYFQGIVYATKGILLIFGTFLAWETRKVTIPALNDSQYIGMCIYNVVLLSIMGVILAYVLVMQVTLQYVLTSSILIFGTTITQAIIFVPKMVKIHEGKEDEDTMTAFSTGNTSVHPTGTSTMDGDLQGKLEKVNEENAQLMVQLTQKEKEIAELA